MKQPSSSQVFIRLGILLLGTSLIYSASLPHFLKGLLSYTWSETTGKIESIQTTTERCHQNYTVRGQVTYSYLHDGQNKMVETSLFKRWRPHEKEEYSTWKKQHLRGSRISVFHYGDLSNLGHWERTYDLKYGLFFSAQLLLGVLFIIIRKPLHTTGVRCHSMTRRNLDRGKI